MAIVKLLVIILFVLVVPVYIGMLVLSGFLKEYSESLLAALAVGTMVMFGVLEIVAVPAIVIWHKFSIIFYVFCGIMGILLFWAVLICSKKLFRLVKRVPANLKKCGVIGIIAAIVVVFQASYLALNLHYDDDDARYIPSIVSALEKDTLFFDNPITGEPMYWDISETAKDMVSPWTVYWAIFSKLCMIHPAILCHTVVPMLYIPLAYVMYMLIGMELFKKDTKKTLVFVTIVGLLNIFSGYSVYNAGAFLLLRIWQGKALFAGIVVPFVLWFEMLFFREKCSKNIWIIGFIAMVAACLTTGMGIFLTPMIILAAMAVHLKLYARWDIYVKMVITMIPSGIFAILYAFGQNLLF